jgi:predicted nucleic acid-binding protein
MEEVLRDGAVAGNLVHDAHIVALCIEHGVSEILTGDRDFRRFGGLKVVDPF